MPQTRRTIEGRNVSLAHLLGIAHLTGGKERKLLSEVSLGYRVSH